jgi:hypothetical protein
MNHKCFTPEDEKLNWWYDRVLGILGLWPMRFMGRRDPEAKRTWVLRHVPPGPGARGPGNPAGLPLNAKNFQAERG